MNYPHQLVWSKKMPYGLNRMASPFLGALPPLFLLCGFKDIFCVYTRIPKGWNLCRNSSLSALVSDYSQTRHQRYPRSDVSPANSLPPRFRHRDDLEIKASGAENGYFSFCCVGYGRMDCKQHHQVHEKGEIV
jgi:hypothetical protein